MTSKRESWLTGRTFAGRFEIGRLIALGGMSEVYQGVDLWTQNAVAIKVMAPRYSADPSKQQKFYREGSSLSQIRHRNIVSVVASSTEKVMNHELMYLVLEYVHGCTLEQLLRVRRVLSVREMLDIILPTVEGLSEVHAMRYIHRDLKPSNILISAEDQSIKITDFGLTRREDQKWTGELMGTPQFVAPEVVVADSPVAQSADIFALGMMMFRMLTGRFPFTGDDQQILYNNVNVDVPSVTRFAPRVNGGIAGIISWCTRRQASARPENAAELFHELKRVVATLTDEDLDYRAPLTDAPVPSYSWWQDVELIAAKSDPSRLVPKSISFSVPAPDIQLAEEVIDDDQFFAPEKYHPYETVVGPASEEDADDYYGEDSTVIEEAPAPISAEYRPQQQQKKNESKTPAQPQETGSRDPRHPHLRLTETPPLTTFVLGAISLLFGLVMAGWVGWWLAQTMLSSQWYRAFTDFF